MGHSVNPCRAQHTARNSKVRCRSTVRDNEPAPRDAQGVTHARSAKVKKLWWASSIASNEEAENPKTPEKLLT